MSIEPKALSISIMFDGKAQYIWVLMRFGDLSKLPSRTKLPLILLQNFALKVPSLNERVYFESGATRTPLYEVRRKIEPLRLAAEGTYCAGWLVGEVGEVCVG